MIEFRNVRKVYDNGTVALDGVNLKVNDGEFVFGPLEPKRHYIIKVYVGGVILNELTVRPRRKRAKT